ALFVLLVIKSCVFVSGQMTAVGITENVKGDVKKFEIWYSGREEVYVVQVRGACGHPEGSPGAVCRGWTLSLCQLACLCACGPGAPTLGAPGNGPGRAPAALSAADLA
ncbi:hypothetical protein XENOCAPTIV_005172, partial [Xenoophorus captivus]